jgi:hypothetical protein
LGVDKKIECVEKFLNFLYQIRKEPNTKIDEKGSKEKLKIDNLTDKIIEDLEALLKMFS